LSTDLRWALRRRKPERRLGQLQTRPRERLVAAADVPASGRPALLLDTDVYIQQAAGRLPPEAEALIARGLLFHCSVCLSELAIGVANTDPSRAGWPRMRDHYAALFDALPASRILTPDEAVWTDAGVLTGALSRSQGFGREQRKEMLNDALIYMTAARAGVPVLTVDVKHFDLLQQLAPDGAFIWF